VYCVSVQCVLRECAVCATAETSVSPQVHPATRWWVWYWHGVFKSKVKILSGFRSQAACKVLEMNSSNKLHADKIKLPMQPHQWITFL